VEGGGGPRGSGGWTGVGAAGRAGAACVEEARVGSSGLVHVTSPVLAFQKYQAAQSSVVDSGYLAVPTVPLRRPDSLPRLTIAIRLLTLAFAFPLFICLSG